MFTRRMFLPVFVFLLISSLARGQTAPPTPDITGWKKTNFAVIDISSEKGPVFYLGHEAEYQNPNNPNEFVKVVSRFIAIASIPPKSSEKTPYIEIANSYLESVVNRTLDDLIKNESDPFLYVHWKTAIDKQTRQVVLDGPVESWLINSIGDWSYRVGTNVSIKNVSEPDKRKPEQFIPVGKEYVLSDAHHVLRADQDYLLGGK